MSRDFSERFCIYEDNTVLTSNHEFFGDNYVGSIIVSLKEDKIEFYNLISYQKQKGYGKTLLAFVIEHMRLLFPDTSFEIEAQPFDEKIRKIIARSYFKLFKEVSSSVKITPKRYRDGELKSYLIKGSF